MRIEPGTRAIVTGASRGIGRATALALAARGARVGLLARNAEELGSLAAEIGPDAIVLPADVTDREALEAAFASFTAEAGGLELAVANAGLAHYGPFADQPIENAEAMVSLNVLGAIYTAHAALERMLARARGHIVVVSSAAALRAFPSAAVYGATKAAERGFAEALRHELSGTGVGVSTVFPGEIETSLHDHQAGQMPDWRRGDDEIPPAARCRGDRRRGGERSPGGVRPVGRAPARPERRRAEARRSRACPAARADRRPAPRLELAPQRFRFLRRTCHERSAGVGSRLPAASSALTSTPRFSLLYACGDARVVAACRRRRSPGSPPRAASPPPSSPRQHDVL